MEDGFEAMAMPFLSLINTSFLVSDFDLHNEKSCVNCCGVAFGCTKSWIALGMVHSIEYTLCVTNRLPLPFV